MTEMEAILGKLPEIKGTKMAPMDNALVAKLVGRVLAGGRELMEDLVSGIGEVDDGKDWKARYLLHAVVNTAAAPGKDEQRTLVAGVLLAEASGDRPVGVRVCLLSQLRLVADETAVAGLVDLLAVDQPEIADAAECVLVTIGEAAVPALKKTAAEKEGRCRDLAKHAVAQIASWSRG